MRDCSAASCSRHPSPETRIGCLRNGDLLLVNMTIFPVIVGALLPSALLATDFLNVFAGDNEVPWRLVQTPLIGLLIALGIRADGVRFALMLGRGSGRTLARILAYAASMAIGAALVGVLLMLWFAYRFNHDTAWSVTQLHGTLGHLRVELRVLRPPALRVRFPRAPADAVAGGRPPCGGGDRVRHLRGMRRGGFTSP